MVVCLNKDFELLRVGLSVIPIRVADVDHNVAVIIKSMKQAVRNGVQVLAFPEMAITGYTIGDLVQQQALLNKAVKGLGVLLQESSKTNQLIIVGTPIEVGQRIFNCAVVLSSGRILGIVPKTLLPNYKEYYENRWFTSSRDATTDNTEILGQSVYFGTDLLFRLNGLDSAIIGIEICEDLWVPLAPHEYQALAGATLLVNISASNEILGKAEWRRNMVTSESGRCLAAYAYVSAGNDESSNDLVYGGHSIIAENGSVLNESKPFSTNSDLLISDIDLQRLVHDRYQQTSYHDTSRQLETFRIIDCQVKDIPASKLYCNINPHPFVPDETERRAERCHDIFSMQVAGLAKKLSGARKNKLVLGISGGLDSTLALLVAIKTMDYLGLPHKNVFTYTLPGFGTTSRTKNNATKLCEALGVSFATVSINMSCKSVLKDLDHENIEDIVFENVQARYRTEFLFNKANQLDGIVLGTGDLTEIALGWATFAGDQLSHYHINASVPKTLVQYLVKWVADEELSNSPAQHILYDILKTPISPELLTPSRGNIPQKSEDIIGPIELADFYLYPFIRFGTRPGKILFMAYQANRLGLFDRKYSLNDLYRWLQSFIKRFFTNQFKRTCMPEGPKVGSVSLSPRGDWRMPSDAEAGAWSSDLEAMYDELKLAVRKK
ncbi:MAG: NAD(+) synthase [Dehalococcoidales bacterium]|nr:NAD(+) synthase [Dehalococcoidales bacterium]